MPELSEQDDREALIESIRQRHRVEKYTKHGIPVFDEFDRSSETREGCRRCDSYGRCDALTVADVLEAVLRRTPVPQQVRTVAEADALSNGTILYGTTLYGTTLYGRDGDVFEIHNGGIRLMGVPSKLSFNWIMFPATVLYRPEGGEGRG